MTKFKKQTIQSFKNVAHELAIQNRHLASIDIHIGTLCSAITAIEDLIYHIRNTANEYEALRIRTDDDNLRKVALEASFLTLNPPKPLHESLRNIKRSPKRQSRGNKKGILPARA